MYIVSRTQNHLDETTKELNALGPGRCVSIQADLETLQGVENVIAELTRQEKGLCYRKEHVHVIVNRLLIPTTSSSHTHQQRGVS